MAATDIEKSYIAGFLDGEGYIIINNTYSPLVGFTNTNIEILEFIQSIYGGTIRSKDYNRKENWKLAYELYICGSNNVRYILDDILSYLRIKRQHALVMLTFLNNKIDGRTQPITEDELEFRHSCYKQLKILNKRGLDDLICTDVIYKKK